MLHFNSIEHSSSMDTNLFFQSLRAESTKAPSIIIMQSYKLQEQTICIKTVSFLVVNNFLSIFFSSVKPRLYNINPEINTIKSKYIRMTPASSIASILYLVCANAHIRWIFGEFFGKNQYNRY